MERLDDLALSKIEGGAAVTLSMVMAYLIIPIVLAIVYRLFMSKKGSTTIPGGFKFTWE